MCCVWRQLLGWRSLTSRVQGHGPKRLLWGQQLRRPALEFTHLFYKLFTLPTIQISFREKKQCCYPSPQKTNTFHSTVGFPWPELVLLDSHTHHIDPAMDLIMFDHVMSMVGPELLQAHAGWGHWPGQVQEDQDLQWCLGGPQAPLSHP